MRWRIVACVLVLICSVLMGRDATAQCSACTNASCAPELIACQAEPSCSSFAICFASCSDGACIEACAMSNPSSETDAVIGCMTASCGAQCGLPVPPAVPSVRPFALYTLVPGILIGVGLLAMRRRWIR